MVISLSTFHPEFSPPVYTGILPRLLMYKYIYFQYLGHDAIAGYSVFIHMLWKRFWGRKFLVEKGQKTGEKWCGNRGFFCGFVWINVFSLRRFTGVCCEQSFPQVLHKLSTGFCTMILIIKKSCIGISKTLNLFYFPIRLFSSVFCLTQKAQISQRALALLVLPFGTFRILPSSRGSTRRGRG